MGFAGLYLCLRHSLSYGRSELAGDTLVLAGGTDLTISLVAATVLMLCGILITTRAA